MDKIKIYRQNGKKWRIPEQVLFEGTRKYYPYSVLGFRKPKKGEWFLSGAHPTAYIAPNDLSVEYLVVRGGVETGIKTVKAYVTSDGKLFSSWEAAEKYQNNLKN